MVYCYGLDIIIMLSLEYLLSSTLLSVYLISRNFGAYNQVNELIMTLFLENPAFLSICTFILLFHKLLSIHPFSVPFFAFNLIQSDLVDQKIIIIKTTTRRTIKLDKTKSLKSLIHVPLKEKVHLLFIIEYIFDSILKQPSGDQ